VTGALVYPAVLIGLSIGLIIILMTYVIPRFTEFFSGFGGDMPALTVAVVGTATFMRRHIVELALGTAAAGFLFSRWRRTDQGIRVLHGLLLKLPILGPVLHEFSLSQFARSLATLVGAGTPLVTALEISTGSVGNRTVADAVASVVPKVRQGAELWRSLEETGQFTSLAVEMIKVGEATGALEDMLTNVSDFYDEAIEASLQTIINLIEPVILIVMGGVIATILLSVYLPMFTILSNIKG
jgi:type IV pilus assembly protein PilC